jgi:hypothetical protein
MGAMATKHKTVRQRIQFAFNADADSVVGTVFQYLIKNHRFSSRDGKRKGIDAMLAFYQPFAYQGSDISDDELRIMAREAIETLARHIDLLCTTFAVDHPGAIATDLQSAIQKAIADALTAESIRVPQDSRNGFADDVDSEALWVSGQNAYNDMDYDTLLGDLQSSAEAAA